MVDTCCTNIPGDGEDTIEAFEQAMNQLKELKDEAHSDAGKAPDLQLDIDLSSVGSFFDFAWGWMKDLFGSLGATIIG